MSTVALTATYAVIHDVLLESSSAERVTPQSLRMLVAIAERGGAIEGASDTLVGLLGSNATAIRRSGLELASAGLVVNTSRRGIGMRLALTEQGRELADAMLQTIRERLAPPAPEAIAA